MRGFFVVDEGVAVRATGEVDVGVGGAVDGVSKDVDETVATGDEGLGSGGFVLEGTSEVEGGVLFPTESHDVDKVIDE